MLIKVISIPFDSNYGGFNDETVRDFLKDKQLISARDYMVIKNDISYLVFVLQYLPYSAVIDSTHTSKGKPDESWRELLAEEDMGLFNLLRDWRSQRSKKEGLPPYIIFTNRHLAFIVKQRPQSLADLVKIDGIGKAKADKYGQDILSITKIDGPRHDQ